MDVETHLLADVHERKQAGLQIFSLQTVPVQDRNRPGEGFTHKTGDIVRISTETLGCLINRVDRSDRLPPWNFGALELMRSLSARGLV